MDHKFFLKEKSSAILKSLFYLFKLFFYLFKLLQKKIFSYLKIFFIYLFKLFSMFLNFISRALDLCEHFNSQCNKFLFCL